ncbi:terpene synthase family protein [Dinghuibacter silviterrae]|nr:terpene synthase family protein [Dinghuibacter silviterrae]
MQSFGLVQGEDIEHYKKQRFGTFIARTFPKGDVDPLCAWSDFNTLLFIVDDQFDQEVIRDRFTCARLVSGFLQIMDGGKGGTGGEHRVVLEALRDLWKRLELHSTRAWRQKMVGCVTKMFEALMWQFDLIAKKERPSMEAYIQNRQYLGAAHLSTDSLELTGKVSVSEAVLDEPMVVRVTELSRNAVCFANDLFSFGKELEESEAAGGFNLVSIIKDTFQVETEEAIEKAAKIHDNTVVEFVDLSQKIEATTGDELSHYVQALKFQMRANIIWSTEETTRYPHIYAKGKPSSSPVQEASR